MNFTIEYGRLAAVFLGDSKAAFEEQLRGELAEFLEPATEFNDFIHSIEYKDRLFIVTPVAGDKARVVAASLQEGPKLDTGPFAGKKIIFPVADEE